MNKNDTMPGIMKTKKKKLAKVRQVDNHYRSSGDEYELVARLAYQKGITIAEYTRKKLIPPNPDTVLDKLRHSQRKEGHPDTWFVHPKLQNGQAA